MIIALCIFFEIEFLFYEMGVFGPIISPFFLFFFSLASGIALMYLSIKGYSEDQDKTIITGFKQKTLLWCTASIGMVIFILLSKPILSEYIITVYELNHSDIIPQISFLVKRLLNGEFPYQTISEWGYKLFPTYMPLQWLPFSVSEYFKFDYRWITITGFTLSIILFSSNDSVLLECEDF